MPRCTSAWASVCRHGASLLPRLACSLSAQLRATAVRASCMEAAQGTLQQRACGMSARRRRTPHVPPAHCVNAPALSRLTPRGQPGLMRLVMISPTRNERSHGEGGLSFGRRGPERESGRPTQHEVCELAIMLPNSSCSHDHLVAAWCEAMTRRIEATGVQIIEMRSQQAAAGLCDCMPSHLETSAPGRPRCCNCARGAQLRHARLRSVM